MRGLRAEDWEGQLQGRAEPTVSGQYRFGRNLALTPGGWRGLPQPRSPGPFGVHMRFQGGLEIHSDPRELEEGCGWGSVPEPGRPARKTGQKPRQRSRDHSGGLEPPTG